MKEKKTQNNKKSHLEFLSGGGEMGKLVREFDWSNTEIGHIGNWPQNLRSVLSVCLNSNFPIAIYWGKNNTLLYNDAWAPIPGNKHPWALGRYGKEVWPEIWDAIEPWFTEVKSTGNPVGASDMILFMERHGYPEECYFDFTFTPIYDVDGNVEGVFNAVIETSYRYINERRAAFCSALSFELSSCKYTTEVYDKLNSLFRANLFDLPCAVVYSIDAGDLSLQSHSMTEQEFEKFSSIKELPWKEIETKPFLKLDNLSDYYKNIPPGAFGDSAKEALLFPLKSGEGDLTGALLCGINTRKKLDKDYTEFLQNVVNIVNISLNNIRAFELERKRIKALEDIDKAKTLFFNNISHEFRTPITLMLGPLEEILNNQAFSLDKNTVRNIETTHRNTLRLLRLVNNLLDFSRIESGKQHVNFSLVDIAGFTRQLAGNFQSVMEKAGLQFKIHADSVIQPVYVDQQMWEKIVFNLLSNAFKYTFEGTITVKLFSENSSVVLQVIDTGIGIPESEIPKMFARFHRVEGAVGRTHEGSGIGLSMIKELVLFHSGSIEVESKAGVGSTFTVRIPTGKDHISSNSLSLSNELKSESVSSAFIEEASFILNAEQNPGENKEFNKDAPLILVVDDNADMREYLKSLLENKYNIITANNGMNALHQLREHQAELILSDVMMPVMDGIQLVKQIKSDTKTSTIPIILLSARAGEEAASQGFESGADDYLVKPFSSRELMARIEAQIKLKQSRNKVLNNLYNLFNEVPFAVSVLMGNSLTVDFINDYNLQIWQKSKEEVLGRPLLEIFSGNEEISLSAHNEVYRTGKRYVGEEKPINILINGKLESKYFSFVIDPFRDENGNIIGQLTTSIDITDQVNARKKIEASENHFRKLIDSAPAIIWLTQPDGACIFLNRKWFEFTGQSPEEAEGFGWLKATHPADRDNAGKIFIKANTERIPFNILYRLRNAMGHYRWAIDSGSPRFSEDGTYEGMIGTVVDVHEEKIAEENLQKTSTHLEMTTTAANVGTWSLDVHEQSLEWSAIHKKLWGYNEHQHFLTYEDWHKVILPEDREEAFKKVERAQAEGLLYEATYRIKRVNDGAIRWMKSSGQYFYNADDIPVKLAGITIDITEEAEVSNTLKESEQRFRVLTESLPQLIWMTDSDGSQLYTSKRWKESTGIEPTGTDTWAQMIHPDDLSIIGEAWKKSLETGEHYKVEVRLKNKHGDYRWHSGQGDPIRNSEGKVSKWIGSFTDIHHQKLVEEELEKIVKARTEQLERSNEDLQRFAHVASHDLKEPVRKIKTYATMLKTEFSEVIPAKGKQYIDKVIKSSERLKEMIEGVLDYSSTNSTEQKIEKVDLNSVVNSVENDLELVIKQKGAKIISQDLPEIEGVPILIYQLFYNLINNSLKFSKPDVPSEIRINSTTENNMLVITVADNGIGFEISTANKIFETFVRLHSKDKYEGTGLGLALCKKIVERHGGTISAKGVLNEGAVFIIRLPLNQ